MNQLNIPRILALAAKLRSPEAAAHFHMSSFFSHEFNVAPNTLLGHMMSPHLRTIKDKEIDNCQTTACIAGWAAVMFAPDTQRMDFTANPAKFAAKLLGLDTEALVGDDADETADFNEFLYMKLFAPWGLSKYTNLDAALVLEHLAETGKIDWSITGKPPGY